MKVLEIIRLEESEQGTRGVLRVNKKVLCCTLEPRDELNKQNISSIPAQQYRCSRVDSERFGDTFQVDNVPGRSGILFHSGNTASDTSGCIILGERFGSLSGRDAVLDSMDAFGRFMSAMGEEQQAHLTIFERY